MPKYFLLSNWCKIIEQCDIMLKIMRPCTTNLNISAFEAMEGMYYFDATTMVPVGTNNLIQIKTIRRQSWGYHAMNSCYFSTDLKNYFVIRESTETGDVRLIDTFKFKHHVLQDSRVYPTDHIIKSTQSIYQTIEGKNDVPPDGLAEIENIRDLILGTKTDNCTVEEEVDQYEIPMTKSPQVFQRIKSIQ